MACAISLNIPRLFTPGKSQAVTVEEAREELDNPPSELPVNQVIAVHGGHIPSSTKRVPGPSRRKTKATEIRFGLI